MQLTPFGLKIALLAGTAVLVNLPLGYLRQGVVKRSLAWFAYIHLSIPLLLWLRLHFALDWQVIPLSILGALLGQFGGGWLRLRLQQSGRS